MRSRCMECLPLWTQYGRNTGRLYQLPTLDLQPCADLSFSRQVLDTYQKSDFSRRSVALSISEDTGPPMLILKIPTFDVGC